jgi:GNAT superfamily N-acetyltransferase
MSELEPSTTLTVRSAMPSDYDTCMGLDHSVSTDFVWQLATDDQDGTVTLTFRTARLPRSMKVLYPRTGDVLIESWQLHAAFLVAQWGADVVGYVNVREERAQESAWVADLAVDRSARMQGIGTALLRAARQWALEHNLRRLIVETQTKNYPAINFLQKRGLVFSGYNDLYYPNQDIAIFFGQSLY